MTLLALSLLEWAKARSFWFESYLMEEGKEWSWMDMNLSKVCRGVPKVQSSNQFLCHFYLWPSVCSNKQLSQSICWCTALIRVVKPGTDVAISTLEADLMRAVNWIERNQFKMNVTKTQLLLVSRKGKISRTLRGLTWVTHIVPQIITIDEYLMWEGSRPKRSM